MALGHLLIGFLFGGLIAAGALVAGAGLGVGALVWSVSGTGVTVFSMMIALSAQGARPVAGHEAETA